MEATIKINTDFLTMDILEGIKKMFPHKEVQITILEESSDPSLDYDDDEVLKRSVSYVEGDEEATKFILNRPEYAKELLSRIRSIENSEAQLVTVKLEDIVQ